jgi:hypothetical protein
MGVLPLWLGRGRCTSMLGELILRALTGRALVQEIGEVFRLADRGFDDRLGRLGERPG